MSLEDNKTLVRRYLLDVAAGGNLALLHELAADDFIDPAMVAAGGPQGREALRLHVQGFRTAFPDAHITIDHLVAEGDTVIAVWTGQGTHQGPFLGIAATGRQSSVTIVSIFRVARGQLAEYHYVWDRLAVLEQFGAAPQS